MKIKTVCLLLSLCHAGAAAALGLGELSVRSSLGQPLRATVAILGANANTSADCFSVQPSPGGIAPPPRVQLSIEQSAGQTLLHIRTRQAIFDPIAQFSVVAECEARLQRDYVVLLDPPAQISPAVADAPAAAQPAASAAPEAPASRAVPPRRHLKRTRPAAAHATAAAARRPDAPRRHAAPHAAPPRLVLSGHRSAPQETAFSLRPDVNLPDLSQPRPDALTATEISDENTALTHKLAYLEAQLIALQKRNADLEAKQAAAARAAVPPPQQPAQWPLYLLTVGLVAGGGGLVTWLLRRNRRPLSGELDGAAWDQADAPIKTLSEMTQEIEETPPAPQRMPDVAPPPRMEGTEVKEDILDQAEVFMAHGHGELAIHLLQEHLRETPTESPVPWLLLLDLLHREGDTAGYAAASAECRRYFNVNLSGHPISQDKEEEQGLEAYPHLLEQLVKVWNTPDIDAFFHDLIYDNRGGTRMGFEPGAYRDILLLREIANSSLKLAA